MRLYYSIFNCIQVFVFAKADAFKNLLKPLQDVARKFISKVNPLIFKLLTAPLVLVFLLMSFYGCR